MGFRFRKSINLGGGFRVNLSKSGIGYSYGVKGLRYTKTAKGKDRVTASIPGTGLSWSTETGKTAKSQKQPTGAKSEPAPTQAVKAEKTPIPVWVKVLAVICGIGFVFYYLHAGNDFGTALISGAVAGGISYLVLCVLYGMLCGAVGAAQKNSHDDVP